MSFLTDLFDRFRHSAPAQALWGQLASGSAQAAGCHDAFARLTAAASAQALGLTLLYIVTDPESAATAASDLSFLYDTDIALLPELPPPYVGLSPHPAIAADHALGLYAAGLGKHLVATVRSLVSLLPPASLFLNRLITVKQGDEHDPSLLLGQLVALGYKRGTRVEVPGEVARRGGILDIYPNGELLPLRLEFDGDTVTSMRRFDPVTQLSSGDSAEVVVMPMRALLPTSVEAEHLRQVIQTRHYPELEAVATRLGEGLLHDGDEIWLPWLHPSLSTVLDYFPHKPLLVMEEPELCQAALEEMWAKADEDHAKAQAEGHVYPKPEELFADEEKLIAGNRALSLYRTQQENSINFTAQPEDALHGNPDLLSRELHRLYGEGYSIVLLSDTPGGVRRLEEIIATRTDLPENVQVARGSLADGFIARDLHLAVLTDAAIFGRVHHRRTRRESIHPDFASSRALASINDLLPGDYVVHVRHGIGRYDGTKLIPIDRVLQDFLQITYRDEAKLYVPIHDISQVQKYLGRDGVAPTLARLGGTEWQRTTEAVRKSLQILAADLIKLYAARAALPGYAFPRDTAWMEELEESFPYEETPDQAQAIVEVKTDMEKAEPMERLLCGDVGFGKTEVAIRAAFKCVLGGKQCAVLVPTTILALQHYETFSERLAPFPVKVEMLSRFRSAKEQKEIIRQIAAGAVDIVIGTHRLLSKDIVFKDLGLLIVDEEHRFGVGHKEKIKKLRETVDVLTMTATPIPRTLSFAMGGARDLNLIETAPAGRLPILTAVHVFDPELIDEAISEELKRDGQVFFVHNRVENIHAVAEWLSDRMPGVRFGVAHGQMEEKELERVMEEFLQDHYDVLITTTIIESGLDIPNANTMIINRADRLGLAQLHQLRGRVGRSDRQAYCYLMVPPLSSLAPQARRRLQAIAESTELGSGFRLALRDLEIRGAGNLLGAQQHGHIAQVGYELYVQMLEEEVTHIRKQPRPEVADVRLELGVPAYLPESYVPDEGDRLELYSRLMKVSGGEDLGALEAEIRDRFGAPPEEAELLLRVARVRQMAARLGISYIRIEAGKVTMQMTARAMQAAMRIKPAAEVGGIKVKAQDGDSIMVEMETVTSDAKRGLAVVEGILREMIPR
jgi:transcription-repair coupling factor (superfamily II helicase)